jgi:hypothetical protein
VVDGEFELPVEGIADHSLTFSPDNRRFAYGVVKPDGRAYLVLDGKAGPVHDGILGSLPPGLAANWASMQTVYAFGSGNPILFSPDSLRLAYVARSGQKFRVYLVLLCYVYIDFIVLRR